MLLWLWPAATAPIRPLAWEPPYAEGVALKQQQQQQQQQKKEGFQKSTWSTHYVPGSVPDAEDTAATTGDTSILLELTFEGEKGRTRHRSTQSLMSPSAGVGKEVK